MTLRGWCECGHQTVWHPNGGPCAYWASGMDDGDYVPRICPHGCKELRLAHVEEFC
jgi:hypothetical protein